VLLVLAVAEGDVVENTCFKLRNLLFKEREVLEGVVELFC
jgi:hypothetical protein